MCASLQQLRPGLEIGLKWPNDVYVQGRKICGILVEVPPRSPDRIVVGIGLNVNNSFEQAPHAVAATATSLREVAGYSFNLAIVVTRVFCQLTDHLAALARATRRCPSAGRRCACSAEGEFRFSLASRRRSEFATGSMNPAPCLSRPPHAAKSVSVES